MPVEINELNATTRLGAPSGESRIPEADVERIARRVIEILAQRERMTKMARPDNRSEEHTSELQSLMRISYAVFCLKKKNQQQHTHNTLQTNTITYMR